MNVWTTYPSPVGDLLLTADETGLTGIRLDTKLPPDAVRMDDHPGFFPARNWLDLYFRGEAPDITEVSIHLVGTAFQQQVWEILMTVPRGSTVTYGQIAKQIAQLRGIKTMSSQAVGQAVGANPISILIPCHRCVGAGGKLTGYAWGLDKKIWLLRHEGNLKEETT